MQAALGIEALARLDEYTARTQAHAERLTQALAVVPDAIVPAVPRDRTHAFYQYCAYVPGRDAVVRRCLRSGIDLETLHVDVCPRLPLFARSAVEAPGADRTADVVQVPVYESLTDGQADRIADVLIAAVRSVRRRSA